MAIQDVLTTIFDYFVDWHGEWNPSGNDNYEKVHRLTDRITDETPEGEYSIRSKAIVPFKTTTERDLADAKERLQNLEKNKVDKGIYGNVGSTDGLAGYQSDWRGFNPKAYGDCHDGLMRWQDKAQLIQLGIWYEKTRSDNKSIGEHMTLWINPAIRICYLKFSYKNFKVSKWDNIYADSAEWDWYSSSSEHLLDVCAPIHPIWAPTNHPHINIGIDTTARFYIRSSEKITKDLTISGSLFWFYRDNNLHNADINKTRWVK